MWISKRVLFGSAAAALIAITGPALADHGKVGLWNIKAHVAVTGTSKTAPDQSFSTQHCMTADEVKTYTPKMNGNDCKMTNPKLVGKTFTADMTCIGQLESSGHLSVTYDSDTHYSGQTTMISMNGAQPIKMNNSFEGNWVSADCGKVTH